MPVRRDPLRVTREPQSVGLFFSLGVDSFYSLLKNLGEDAATGEEITHLVLGRGLDVSLERGNSAVFPKVLAHGREVARQVGKKLLPIASNVREFTTQFADWAEVTHGAAMAGMALSLEAMFAQVLIAATHTHDNLFSWGSHPHLDPLWSTETLSFVHDGCEATRLDKMRVLAISRVALQHLRVCLTNTGNQYNCGRCEKCLRTMLGLHVIDALRPCTTLPDVIDPSHLQDVTIDGHVDRHYREVLPLLGSSAEDRAIRDAVERLLRHVTPKRVAPAILGEET